MRFACLLGACLALASAPRVLAHMEMKYPPPLRSSYNPFTGDDVDYDMPAPLNANGSDYPCKGYAGLFGTSQGRPVAAWAAGSQASMTITGDSPHSGGSCQASFSYDRGRSWIVVHSYIGNCPLRGDSTYAFRVPGDMPPGDVLFGWSWFNKEGNREMYMNCAAVTITRPDGGAQTVDSDPLTSRPAMFVANIGNGICTYEGTDVDFPQPGPDVTRNSARPHAPGRGSCSSWGG